MRLARFSALVAVLVAAVTSSVFLAEDVRIRPVSSIYVDSKGSGLARPEGVACGDGDLWISDTGNARILRYAVVDRGVQPVAEIRHDALAYPTRLARTADGGVLVVDGKRLRVGRVGPEGGFAGWLSLPDGRSEPIPRSVDVAADGREFVLDVANSRVDVFGPGGDPAGTIDLGHGFGFLSDLVVGSAGSVYLVDPVASRVWVSGGPEGDPAAAPLGSALDEYDVKFPVAIVVRSSGQLILADQNAGDLVVLGANGEFEGRSAGFGWTEGYLRYPSALCLDGELLFVADRENDRVQIFSVSE